MSKIRARLRMGRTIGDQVVWPLDDLTSIRYRRLLMNMQVPYFDSKARRAGPPQETLAALNSGTSALPLALAVAGVRAGNEVISRPLFPEMKADQVESAAKTLVEVAGSK